MRDLTTMEILVNNPQQRENLKDHLKGEAKYGLPRKVLFCKRCVISNQRPNSTVEHANKIGAAKATINFDAEGVCDACRAAEQKEKVNWDERERELRELCAAHRRSDGAYDCIVPGSGGKDSFFAAHVLRHKYGMHPLLVTWAAHSYTDWGFRNLCAWQAIADSILVTPRRSLHRLLTRLALENLFHPFQPFVIGQKNMAPRLAEEYKIPLVFYGENEAEYGNPLADTGRATRDSRYHTGTDMILAGEPVSELARRFGLTEREFDIYRPAQSDYAQVHYLGYYLRWHPQACYYYAVEHGGFECAPERSPGTYSKYNSIDCKTDDFHYWTQYIKFGIGRATYDAAQEIRSGEITREEGVALVRKFDGEYPTRFEQEMLRYLSVPSFVPATREWLLSLAERFKSHHIWDGDKLRHVVS